MKLYRFGAAPETREKLAADAARAEGALRIHGVSTTSQVNPARGVPPSAEVENIERHFRVHKTAGPHHYTVELPKPVTQDVADLFNLIFGRKS